MFSNDGSIERLMGAVPMEENDRRSPMNKVYYQSTCRELDEKKGVFEKKEVLAKIALMQKQMRLAA